MEVKNLSDMDAVLTATRSTNVLTVVLLAASLKWLNEKEGDVLQCNGNIKPVPVNSPFLSQTIWHSLIFSLGLSTGRSPHLFLHSTPKLISEM